MSTDPNLQFATDEGPHVTRWKGDMWFNWEPRCDDTAAARGACEKNVLKSTDGGLHWVEQPANLFNGSGCVLNLYTCICRTTVYSEVLV